MGYQSCHTGHLAKIRHHATNCTHADTLYKVANLVIDMGLSTDHTAIFSAIMHQHNSPLPPFTNSCQVGVPVPQIHLAINLALASV